MNRPLFKLSSQSGVTLVELMIVVVLIGILAALAVPSFSRMMQRQRIEGAAEVLTSALQNAKAEAVKRGASVGIVFTPNTLNTDLNTWCFGMQLGAVACDCSATTNNCAPGSIVSSSDFAGVTTNFSVADRTFNPLRGTVAAGGTATFAVETDKLGVTTTVLGDTRICRPDGTTMSSYADSGACP